jgi:hypothetical protein
LQFLERSSDILDIFDYDTANATCEAWSSFATSNSLTEDDAGIWGCLDGSMVYVLGLSHFVAAWWEKERRLGGFSVFGSAVACDVGALNLAFLGKPASHHHRWCLLSLLRLGKKARK